MELALSDIDRRLYTKLYASSSDIALARDCAAHLLRKNWFRPPWTRGSIYFQQSAFVTALVVSYARPFATGKRGRGAIAFPEKLLGYDADEKRLHVDLLARRNTIYAHSDPELWEVRPWRSGSGETTIIGQPHLILPRCDAELLVAMTTSLLTRIRTRCSEITAAY